MGIFNSYDNTALDEYVKQEQEKSYGSVPIDTNMQGHNSMNDEFGAVLLFAIIILVILGIVWLSNGKPSIGMKDFFKDIWKIGTSEPIQRIGLIILSIGIISFIGWFFKREVALEEIFNPYYFPERRDFIFFHLYLYFIPIGLLMTWGYQILVKIKKWIFNDGNKKEAVSNTNILHFKDNAAAFEMACKFFSGELKKNMAYVGIVDLFDRSVRPDEVSLFVAIDGKSEMAFGFINKETEIKKGDLVLWGFWEMANLGTEEYDVNIPFGIILAIIKPSYDPSKNKWLIERDLTKQQP